MKNLRQIVCMLALLVSFALSVPAQNGDQKRPPKNPPVRDPKEKPPKDNPPPKGDDRPKKPGMAF
jgi:hypothetical protein